ncbi:MAG: hypothetical protein IJZ20_02445, partial [Clostridia bacterium]|nr:hypothetical protein [Clostridia bacterium]
MSLSKKMLACIAAGLLASTSAGAAVFEKTNEYTSQTFNDVPEAEWYADEVAGCYELGFMNG